MRFCLLNSLLFINIFTVLSIAQAETFIPGYETAFGNCHQGLCVGQEVHLRSGGLLVKIVGINYETKKYAIAPVNAPKSIDTGWQLEHLQTKEEHEIRRFEALDGYRTDYGYCLEGICVGDWVKLTINGLFVEIVGINYQVRKYAIDAIGDRSDIDTGWRREHLTPQN